MSFTFPWISVLLLLPLTGAFFLFFIKGEEETVTQNSRNVSLWVTAMTFLFSIILFAYYDGGAGGFQFIEKRTWLNLATNLSEPPIMSYYFVGVDGISSPLIVLATLLTMLVVLFSFGQSLQNAKTYYILFLVMEFCILGALVSLDTVLFYIFFEALLIPMFFIIGLWGGKGRLFATFNFFIYTFVGSILLLICILYLKINSHAHDLIFKVAAPAHIQHWLFFGLFVAFAIKIPMLPFHTWLPKAHVEAPTGGSVILAGILLKLGAYGMIRFILPLTPLALMECASAVSVLSVITLIYASLVALTQDDMKKMVAYSSIAHMAFVSIAIFNPSLISLKGALMVMVAHGLVSSALFFCVGYLYEQTHSLNLNAYGALAAQVPRFATLAFVVIMGAVALPLTANFVGEFMVLLGLAKTSKTFAALMALGMVLGALYPLRMFQKLFWGTQEKEQRIEDIKTPQGVVLGLLGFCIIVLGVMPSLVLDQSEKPIKHYKIVSEKGKETK